MTEVVHLTREGAVATITMDRASTFNALDMELGNQLYQRLLDAATDASIRAVVLTGANGNFCAGGDLRAMKNSPDRSRFLLELAPMFHTVIATMARLPKPLVAAVEGMAVGGGLSFALACDMVWASETAQFSYAYSKVGLVPDGGSSFLLPRVVGRNRAMEMYYTNKFLGALEAQEWGIVSKVFSTETFRDEVSKRAAKLAAGPTKAYALARQLFLESFSTPLETQAEKERQFIAQAGGTEDFQEGLDAFFNHRAPNFKGK